MPRCSRDSTDALRHLRMSARGAGEMRRRRGSGGKRGRMLDGVCKCVYYWIDAGKQTGQGSPARSTPARHDPICVLSHYCAYATAERLTLTNADLGEKGGLAGPPSAISSACSLFAAHKVTHDIFFCDHLSLSRVLLDHILHSTDWSYICPSCVVFSLATGASSVFQWLRPPS